MQGCLENPFANDTSLDPRPLPPLRLRRRWSSLSEQTDKSTTIISQLLTPVVLPRTYQQLLTNKERQVLAYNSGAKDLGAL